MKLKLVTDASCAIPIETLEERSIGYLESIILIEEESYRECTELDRKQFIESLPTRDPYPSSSQASVQDAFDVFTKAFEQGYDHILYLSLTPEISSVSNSARMAIKRMKDKKENITIYQTDLACTGQGAMVEHAWRLLQAGKSVEEIITHLDSIKSEIYTLSVGADFEAVFKSGKVKKSPILNVVSSTFKLKPIGELLPGKGFVAIGAGMGFGKAIKKMMDNIEEKTDPNKEYELYLADCFNPKMMSKIEKEVKDIRKISKTFYWQTSCVTAVSAGLGNVMLTLCPKLEI